MKFDENPKLELMSKPTVVDEKKDPNRTGFVHICIKVDSREKLDEIIAKFKAANYTILYEPQRTAAMRSAPSRLRTTSSRSAAKWQHRTITSLAFAGYFSPILRFEKIEIHKVFLHFSNLASTKNLSPNALAELCGAAQNHRRRNYNDREEQAVFNGKKKVIGMVHLLPLPGNAAYQNNKEEIVKNAIEDAHTLIDCGR